MISRATAFVILGMCIGILIGLVKVVLKEAWLTVLDGYRPGRQLILSEAQTVLGRAEYAALPFMAPGDSELEMVHARIIRQPDGRFALEDNQTRLGTEVNNVRVNGRVLLDDGAVIRLGRNSIRFSERQRRAQAPGDASRPRDAGRIVAAPDPGRAAGAADRPTARPPVPRRRTAPTADPGRRAPDPAPPVAAPAPRPAPVAAGTKTMTTSAAPATAAGRVTPLSELRAARAQGPDFLHRLRHVILMPRRAGRTPEAAAPEPRGALRIRWDPR